MTWLPGIFAPTRLLLVMTLVGIALALVGVLVPTVVGLLAVAAISAALSLMFPTIYGVTLDGLGSDTRLGAAGLVMAILGGALFPLLQGKVADLGATDVGRLVVVGCLVVVGGHALHDIRSRRPAQAGDVTG